MSTILENARKLRAMIVKGSESLDDKDVSTTPEVLKRLKEDGSLIPVGTRINWNGTVKKAAVDLYDTAENNPDNASNLWESILYKDGYRIIPEVLTVTTAFSMDEIGWWNDTLYKSTINANVYTPDQYPNGWEVVN